MAKKDVFAPVDTDHPAFRSWFGKSVLHDNGVPRTYYHGTSKDADFKKFKMSRHGVWMTTDPEEASKYAADNDSQGFRRDGWDMKRVNTASRVIPVHARIEKPFVGEMPKEYLQENYKKSQSDWFDALRSNGYDGWVPKSQNGKLAVALAHPGQIKSALSNTGDYSETGDINKAEGGSVKDYIPHDDPRRARNLKKFHGKTPDAIKNTRWYHGTNQNFQAFQRGKSGAIFVSPDPEFASFFATDEDRDYGEPNVMPVHVRAEKPFDYENVKHLNALAEALGPQLINDPRLMDTFNQVREGFWGAIEDRTIQKGIRSLGHDSFFVKERDESGEPSKNLAVYDPSQLKSATGNNGNFAREEDDITKAAGGSVDDEDEGLTAYHGSPHDFERFDINKIGTGEGAQAYGHGLYFAESEPVAKGYRDRLREEYAFVDDKKIPHPSEENPESNLVYTLANQLYQMGWNTDQAIDFANKHAESLKDDLTSENFYKKGKAEHAQKWARDIAQFKGKKIEWKQDPGNMYEVRIKAKPEHFLDWDEPLYRQPEAVRRLVGITPEYENEWFKWFKQDNDSLLNALENDVDYRATKEPARPQGGLRMMMNGSDIYEHLHNKMGAIDWPIDADSSERANVRKTAAERVSQHLKENGVPGIRYLDAGSRDSGEGSRNYVVFDHDLVKVKRKYALGGAV